MLAYLTKDQVATLLRDKREQSGMAGGEVSEKLKMYGINLSKTTIWGYENGVSRPSVSTFLALCRIYEIENEILDGETCAEECFASEEEESLLTYFRLASPELRAAALRMLEPAEKENTGSVAG